MSNQARYSSPRIRAAVAVAAVVSVSMVAHRLPAVAQDKRGAPAAQVQPTGPVGTWIDHTGRGAVEIVPCDQVKQDPRQLCGRIIWLKDPNDDKGKPLRDILNKDVAKRGKPICGLQIIGALKQQRDGSWDEGWIYDPEKGSSFDVELRMRSPEQLQVKGYLGVKFLNETYVWKRAPTPPPKCSA